MSCNRQTKQERILCVAIPCYNEEDVVEHFYEVLKHELLLLHDICHIILFVDDGSTDGTLERLNMIAGRDDVVNVCSLSLNLGHQVSLSAALDFSKGDALLMMDCDMQHPPSIIPLMIKLWLDGYDVVSAVRENTADASVFKRMSSRVFYWLINHLSETRIIPGVADFHLLSKRAYQALRAMPERHRFLRGMVAWIGFSRAYVPFQAPARELGDSSYTLPKMRGLAMDALFSFTTAPIKLATRIGFAVLLVGAIYFSYILARYYFIRDLLPGWGSLICTVLLLGGMQLIFVGMIGEYLARVFEEAKGRPLYFLKQSPDDD